MEIKSTPTLTQYQRSLVRISKFTLANSSYDPSEQTQTRQLSLSEANETSYSHYAELQLDKD